MIQRELQDRVRKEMVPYLLNEPQRFYGALVTMKVRELKQKYRDLIEDEKASLLPAIEWAGNPNYANNNSESSEDSEDTDSFDFTDVFSS